MSMESGHGLMQWDYEAWAPNEPSANPVDGDYVEFNNAMVNGLRERLTRITLMAIFVRGSQHKNNAFMYL